MNFTLKINREDPGCGNLITFSQFLVIAIEGFLTTMQFGKRKLQVPFKYIIQHIWLYIIDNFMCIPYSNKSIQYFLSHNREYFKMVLMFFIVSVANNYALNFNIALPLHMVFR